jgi:hypothetical protein
MTAKNFEEWWESYYELIKPFSFVDGKSASNCAWSARQPEIDDLRQHLEAAEDLLRKIKDRQYYTDKMDEEVKEYFKGKE